MERFVAAGGARGCGKHRARRARLQGSHDGKRHRNPL